MYDSDIENTQETMDGIVLLREKNRSPLGMCLEYGV